MAAALDEQEERERRAFAAGAKSSDAVPPASATRPPSTQRGTFEEDEGGVPGSGGQCGQDSGLGRILP